MATAGDPQEGQAGRTAFLSYARADQAQVARLADALRDAGVDVWWDTLIEGGAEFAQRIEAAIDRADAVVVAWSARSVVSDWVLDEAARGRGLHKLVPVSLDGTEPPMGFRRYHTVDLRGWIDGRDGAAIDRVVRGIRTVAAGASVAPVAQVSHGPDPAATPRDPGRRRLLVVAAGLVGVTALAGTAFVWQRERRRAAPSRGNSVAVLPFENLDGDAARDYFSNGLAEEVRATLARDARLQVMAQASSGKFRDSAESATTIAEQLGVAYLLSGSVRRAGDTVRVAADLIDGGSGFSRWSHTFERRIDDIFRVQTEIAGTVADALVARIEADERTPEQIEADERAAAGSTRNIAAFDSFLRGRALYDLSADEESERAALAQFDAAIAADPQYAAAHAARARSLTTIANLYGSADSRGPLYDAAIDSAERAIELAPGFADAHSTLGFTLFQGRLDAQSARAPFERSIELGAGESTVLARFAQYSARTGDDTAAVPAIRRALVLDPLNPLIHRAAGAIEYAARRYEESIPHLRRALAMNPRMSRARAAIGDALFMLGRAQEARAEYVAEPGPDFRLAGLAVVERRLGDTTAARQAFDQLVAELGDRALYQQAQVLAQWGETAAALDRLDRARVVGDAGLIYARNDPLLDPLRAEARFGALLRTMGFSPLMR